MSISNSYPTQTPSLNLNFATGSDQFLDSRISFSRADTPPTYAAPSAVHYWSNEKHLSSENLLRYSNPNNALWVESKNATITTNSVSAPDGSTTASKITEDSTAGVQHRTYISQTVGSGETFTYVGYLKANGRTIVQLSTTGAGASAGVEFNLSGSGTATTRSGSPTNASITQIGTDWYKCSFQVSSTSSALLYTQIVMCDAANSTVYDGDGTSGVYAWGFSLSSTGETVLNETSGSIHREFAPTLKSVANAGDPRFEYSPTDGQSVGSGTAKGLLVEGQSSNLFARSSGFDYTAAWTKTNVTATADAISPDGTLNAFAIRESSSGGTKRIYQAATVAAGSVAVSVYAKLLGNERRLVIREDSATGDSAVFDLSSGTVAATNVGGAGTIESVGNGWYRCTLITSPTGSPGYQFGFWLATATGTNYESYTGDGYSGVLLFGAMCENASASSSYLESLGSTTTRAADSCSVVSEQLFDNGGGTLYAEVSPNNLGSTFSGIASINAGGLSDRVELVFNNSAARATVVADGTTYSTQSGGSYTAGDEIKSCLTYANDNVSYYVNGSEIGTTDTSSVMPVVTNLSIGNTATGSWPLNGHLKRVAVYSDSISETAAAALTTI